MERKRNILKTLFSFKISGTLIFLILIYLFTGLINPNFWSLNNLINLLRLISYLSFVSIGMTFVIVGGGIDLSVGSVIGLGGVVVALALKKGVPIILAILLSLFVGLVFGYINGLIITKIKIPPFIVTLGTMYAGMGIVYILSKARPIYPLPDAFNKIGTAELFGVSYTVYIMIVLLIVSYFVLNHTVYGRSLTAAGGNELTAKTSGIDVARVKLISYAAMGFLAALTGILMTARMNSAVPQAGGGWESKAIASAIIGGTSITGGVGSVLGTLVGAAIMAVLENAMVMLKISVYWQNVVVGVVIIFAVTFDHYKRVKSN